MNKSLLTCHYLWLRDRYNLSQVDHIQGQSSYIVWLVKVICMMSPSKRHFSCHLSWTTGRVQDKDRLSVYQEPHLQVSSHRLKTSHLVPLLSLVVSTRSLSKIRQAMMIKVLYLYWVLMEDQYRATWIEVVEITKWRIVTHHLPVRRNLRPLSHRTKKIP